MFNIFISFKVVIFSNTRSEKRIQQAKNGQTLEDQMKAAGDKMIESRKGKWLMVEQRKKRTYEKSITQKPL